MEKHEHSPPYSKRRLAFVTSTMRCGGAERVISLLANYWAEKGWEILLVSLEDSPSFYPLHPSINFTILPLFQKRRNNFFTAAFRIPSILRELRKVLTEFHPDAVIAFMTKVNVVTLLSTLGAGLHVIVSERTHPKDSRLKLGWRICRRLLYPNASCVVSQSASIAADLGFRNSKVIPNPIPRRAFAELVADTNTTSIGALGRLHYVKGFDLLFRAFALIAKENPMWTLSLWGDGEERGALEKLRDELGLSGRVFMPGTTPNPMMELSRCAFMAAPSRIEGFSNAVCEALSIGVPVVAYRCPGAMDEIIRDGVDGLLVEPENVEALAASMNRMIHNKELRSALSKRGPEVLERFDFQKVMGEWESLIDEFSR